MKTIQMNKTYNADCLDEKSDLSKLSDNSIVFELKFHRQI